MSSNKKQLPIIESSNKNHIPTKELSTQKHLSTSTSFDKKSPTNDSCDKKLLPNIEPSSKKHLPSNELSDRKQPPTIEPSSKKQPPSNGSSDKKQPPPPTFEPTNQKQLLTVDDFRTEAALKLKKAVREYFNGGSDEELTLARNESAFRRLLIRPRCLRDVSEVDTSVEWFGEKLRYPIGIAPTAFHRMAEKSGEMSTVRGASLSGSLMIASSWSTTPIEPMAHEAKMKDVPLWFQLYIYKDKSITSSLITRAQDSGCKAIVLTVDTPVLGSRLADTKNAFSLPEGLTFANFTTVQSAQMPLPSEGQSAFMRYVGTQIDPALDWKMLDWVISNSKVPVIVKGIMRGDDAEEAISRGARGIIVSNHGGRQLDSAPATIEALPEIVRIVNGRVPVFIDGGFRNGRDVFKAIALGASGVFIGRPVLWGLSVAGAEGVFSVMTVLQAELEHTMKLAGCRSIKEIQESPDIVVNESYYAKL